MSPGGRFGRFQRQIDLAALLGGRGISAVPNLAIIPLVLKSGGAAAYGKFSIEYSGLIAIIAFFSTVCVQPTYKHYDGSADERPEYIRIALVAGIGALATAGVLQLVLRFSPAESLLGAGFAFLQTAYTGFITVEQIRKGALRASAFEFARGLVTLLPMIVAYLLGWRVDAAAAFSILGFGYLLGALVLVDWRAFADLIRRRPPIQQMGFGAVMGVWLAASTAVYLGVKLLVRERLAPAPFATFAVELDLASRVVGLFGSMIVVNYFPRIADAIRRGANAAVDRFIREALVSLVSIAAAVAILLGGASYLTGVGGWRVSTTSILIYVAVVIFQASTIVHKPLELAGRAAWLFPLLIIANLAGLAVAWAASSAISPEMAAAVGVGAAGLAYWALVETWWRGIKARDPERAALA